MHCRFFSGKRENETFAKLGDFTVTRGQEFQDLLHEFRNASFIGDDTDGIAEAISEAWER